MQPHRIVSEQEWRAARIVLLTKEMAFLKARDRLSAERRELPWVKVEKNYVFDGPNGKETLADLSAGRSQLIRPSEFDGGFGQCVGPPSSYSGIFGRRSACNDANLFAGVLCALVEVDDDTVCGHD
jgi:hypothetical protein